MQFTLEAESYLHPHMQQLLTASTLPISPLLGEPSVAELSPAEQCVTVHQLVAATPNQSDPMLSIRKRLDEIESQLKVVVASKKWDCSKPPHSNQRSQTHPTDRSQAQHKRSVVCFKCGQERHFARGCAVRRRTDGDKQPLNTVSEATNSKHVNSGDAIPAVSQCTTTDYNLQGAIEGIPARFLVDTGATMSVLNKNIWTRLNQQTKYPLTEVTGKKLVGIEGTPLKVLGAAHFHVVFEQQQFNVYFLVADSLTTEAILGRDFLKDNQCVIDIGKNLIKFETVGMTLKLMCSPGDSQIAHVSVVMNSVLHVPGCSEIEIMAKVLSAATGGSWIVEGDPAKSNAVMVARTLVSPNNQTIPVRLLNPRSETITVSKGTTIAMMEAVAVTATSDPVTGPKCHIFENMASQLGDRVSTVQHDQLLQLLLEFSDIFAANPNDLGRTNLVRHHIDTENAHPIRQQARRILPAKREETNNLLHKNASE